MRPDLGSGHDPRRLFPAAAALFALLSCVYLITTSSRFRLDDEHILAARAQGLAVWGEADQPQVLGNSRVRDLATQGDRATQIEPLLPWLGAVIYAAAIRSGVGGAQALFILNPWLTAATAVVVFLSVIVLGHTRRAAGWCGLLFGLGTMAWPYATTLLRDSLAMALVSLAYLGIALWIRGLGLDRVYGPILIGTGFLGGALAKNTVVALAFGVGLAALGSAALRLRSSRRSWRPIAAIVGAGLGMLLILAIVPEDGPLARFSLGYYSFLAGHFSESLRGPFLVHALGPFLSPAKSIFLFSPPALLVLPSLVLAFPRHRSFAPYVIAGALGLAAAQALFYREQWAGSVGWGLRFMLPALTPQIIAAAPAVERMLESRRKWTRGLLLGLLVASGAIQMAGSVVEWGRVYSIWTENGLDPFLTSSAWQVRFLAVPRQLSLLADPSTWTLLWPRLASGGSRSAMLVPIAATMIGLCGLFIINRDRRDASATGNRALASVLLVAAILLPVFPTLPLAAVDPAFGGGRPEFEAALRTWEREGRPSDEVLVDSYGTPLWAFLMNRWSSAARWTSLPYEIPDPSLGSGPAAPSVATLAILEAAQTGEGRIAYIASDEAPDAGLRREVTWLDAHDQLIASAEFDGVTRVVLRIYCGCRR